MRGIEETMGAFCCRTDPLTGLNGRRAFLDVMKGCTDCAGMGILAADLDRLGQINRAGGYLCGDECIRRAAERVSSILSGQGVLFRAEGGAFAVLLRAGAAELETLAAKLTGGPPVQEGEPAWSLTVGWAVFSAETDENLADVWNRARRAMRERKGTDKGPE